MTLIDFKQNFHVVDFFFFLILVEFAVLLAGENIYLSGHPGYSKSLDAGTFSSNVKCDQCQSLHGGKAYCT